MLLLVSKRIPSNLQQVTVLKHAVVHGLTSPKTRACRLELHARSVHADHGMPGKNVGILKQIDIRLLPAADAGLGLIQDELLARERTGYDVEPSVLQRAFHQAHTDACGQAYQCKSHRPAHPTNVGCHRDRVEQNSTQPGSNRPTQHTVGSLLRRLPYDSIAQ